MRWYVCDMDNGVLRIEESRKAAVAWWMDHQDASKVIERYTYGPGYYSYIVGYDAEDCRDAAIVREDCLEWYGLDVPVADIKPIYPYRDRPHEMVEDDVRLLAVHPALWDYLVAWLQSRSLDVGKVPGENYWITTPIDEAFDRER